LDKHSIRKKKRLLLEIGANYVQYLKQLYKESSGNEEMNYLRDILQPFDFQCLTMEITEI